jgi:hypothetical protein
MNGPLSMQNSYYDHRNFGSVNQPLIQTNSPASSLAEHNET